MRGLARIQASLGLRADAEHSAKYGPLAAFVEIFGSRATGSGVQMTPSRAMQISAVYSCVRILSNAVANLPLDVYRRTKDGGKERAPDHPAYALLKFRPNSRHTASEFRDLLQGDVEVDGNGYAAKVIVGDRIEQLVPVSAHRMRVHEDDAGGLHYEIAPKATGSPVTLPASRVLHLRGPFGDGVVAGSPAVEFRELFGLAYAIEVFLGATFANGVRTSGALSSPSKLSDKAYDNLKQWLRDEYQGYVNAGKPLLLEEGLTWTGTSQTNEQAQVVELQDKVTAAIGRVYQVPLHMLAAYISQPRANMEQAAAEFVAQALRWRLVRWEERLQVDVLGSDPEHFAEFNLEDLLRGDSASRAEVYRTLVEIGVMTRNEVRIRENLNPLPGLDEPLTPLNMQRGQGDPPAAAMLQLAEWIASSRKAAADGHLVNGARSRG